MVLCDAESISRAKNTLLVVKGLKIRDGCHFWLKIRARLHIKRYAILTTGLNLPKTVFKSNIGPYNNQDVNTKVLGVHGFSEVILFVRRVYNRDRSWIEYNVRIKNTYTACILYDLLCCAHIRYKWKRNCAHVSVPLVIHHSEYRLVSNVS